MWQLAVAAALAGSGLLATRLFNTDPHHKTHNKRSDLFTNPPDFDDFEFSSPDNGVVKKKKGNGFGGKVGKKEGILRKCESKKSVKGFGVCVKKRRVTKFGPGKCDSCSSNGNSNFRQGIGVGIMCMMSAGKAEINKLNTAMDETAKVVNELKFEISKRKSSVECKYNVQNYSTCVSEEGECERSTLSQGEVMEMDFLEAELESELQKLSWFQSDASVPEERRLDSYENEASTEGIYEGCDGLSNLVLSNAVMPSVLNQKLCNVLIKQQKGQIVELETELHEAQTKLNEKEAELQALKDCVRRMSQFSIDASDDETEKQVEEEKSYDLNTIKIGSEPHRPMVGMKRTMSFGSYSCHVTSQSN